MDAASPPLTPIRQYMSPLDTSPTNSYREQLRRRTSSSFSSNHDRSPVTPRSSHRYSIDSQAGARRFSNSSRFSNDLPTPGNERNGGGGLGNLADELDQLDDDEYEGDHTESTIDVEHDEYKQPVPVDGARDSGVDVSYSSSKGSPIRNFSKPFAQREKPPDEEEREAGLSRELENEMNNIARMTSYTSTMEDPLIPKTIALLQDLGNQSLIEAGAQRLTTSTNSLTSHMTVQTKQLQLLSTGLLNPFTFSAPLDPVEIDDIIPLVQTLAKDLPYPDPEPLQGLQKLERETANVIQTLSSLTDTLQIGKQATNAASRHLRTTQTIVAELRRERERADSARHELQKGDWESKIAGRWCGMQCKDVLSGFEETCEALRESLGAEDVPSAV